MTISKNNPEYPTAWKKGHTVGRGQDSLWVVFDVESGEYMVCGKVSKNTARTLLNSHDVQKWDYRKDCDDRKRYLDRIRKHVGKRYNPPGERFNPIFDEIISNATDSFFKVWDIKRP